MARPKGSTNKKKADNKPVAKIVKAKTKKAVKIKPVIMDDSKSAKDNFYQYGEQYGLFISGKIIYAKTQFMTFNDALTINKSPVFMGTAIDLDGNEYVFVKEDNKYTVDKVGE